ncbi:MAG: aromatic amino acid lyase [Microbacterium sp.]
MDHPRSSATVTITTTAPVTLADLVALADGADVALAPEVHEALARVSTAAEQIAATTPTYGRSTGVGANRTTPVSDAAEHGMRLVRSHATDTGPALPTRTVRAMIAVRLAQLSQVGSGIAPGVLPALAGLLRQGELAEIGSVGSIGTGDLPALAALALILAGERAPGTPASPVRWSAESALPFLSSNALTIARSVLASAELRQLDHASRVVFALAATALRGNPSAFSETAAAAAAAPQVSRVCAEVRGLLPADIDPARIQDPFGLRVYPVTQGALLTALERLDAQLLQLVNAAQENPLFDVAERTVIHHGSFFQAQLAIDLDTAALALAQSATNAHALLRMANEPAFTGLRPFLATGPAGASGLMMLEYTAASALAEIRNAAAPACVGTIALSRGAEEDASFASQGAAKLERAAASYRIVLGCQLLAVSRLLVQLDPSLAKTLEDPARAVRALQESQRDQDLRASLDEAYDLLDQLAAHATTG